MTHPQEQRLPAATALLSPRTEQDQLVQVEAPVEEVGGRRGRTTARALEEPAERRENDEGERRKGPALLIHMAPSTRESLNCSSDQRWDIGRGQGVRIDWCTGAACPRRRDEGHRSMNHAGQAGGRERKRERESGVDASDKIEAHTMYAPNG